MYKKVIVFLALIIACGCQKDNRYALKCYNADAKAHYETVFVDDDELMRMASFAIYEDLKVT